jgi:hypothetical protein
MAQRKASKRQGAEPKAPAVASTPDSLAEQVIERCRAPFQFKVKMTPEGGAVHCGFRIDPEVFVGRLTWKRTPEGKTEVRLECSSINPKTLALEGRLDNIIPYEV